MSKAFSLQPLLEIMRERTDEATRRLGQLVAAEQNARSRLQLLTEYREEYFQRFREAQAQGLTLSAWKNYQEFIDKLDEAISHQEHLVNNSAQNTAEGQEHWRTQNTRMKAIDTLSVRHTQAIQRKENKQEQKLLDEYTTRRHVHGNPK